MSTLTVLSLFSGIGGLDLGLERAGMCVIAQSEVDPYASRVLARHWPNVPNLGDITTITDWPNADVVCGGFPCQDISVAGKGAGIQKGTRSGLWYDYARCVRSVRPRYVVVENVAALLTRGFDIVQSDLAALGYDAWWDCIPAASVGAPHLRDRVFIVATRADITPVEPRISPMQWAARVGSDAECVGGDSTADADSQRGDRSAAEHGPNGWTQPARNHVATADAGDERCEEHSGVPVTTSEEITRTGRVSIADWWSVEPGVGRVAHGIPRRVDRLRCLGNAVVPQVAQYIGQIVVEHNGRSNR